MFERMKRKAAAFLAVCMITVLFQGQFFQAFAANVRIAFSDPSVTVGGQVTVNMKITADSESLSSADVTLSYDSNALEFVEGTDAEGGAGAIRVHGDGGTPNTGQLAFTLTFNALTAGSTGIQVTNQEVYNSDSQLVEVNQVGSSAVTVEALATASTDASLKSLQVSPGTLSPAFSPDVDSYTVSVGTDVEKLIISAETTDENANLVINGNEALEMGENRVTCLVTAQDGETTREYVITVTKEEGGASAGSETTGEEVKLYSSAKTITILEPEEGVTLPDGFIENPVEIDGHTVRGWVWAADADRQYCIVYGMNEQGEKNFYRFDLKENTIQRYFQDPAAADGVTEENYNELAQMYNDLTGDYRIRGYVIGGLAVVAVVLLVLLIVLIHTTSKGQPGPSDREGQKDRRASGGKKESRKKVREQTAAVQEPEDLEIIETDQEPEPETQEEERTSEPEPEEMPQPEPEPEPEAEAQPGKAQEVQPEPETEKKAPVQEEEPVQKKPEPAEKPAESEAAGTLEQDSDESQKPEEEEDDEDFEIFDIE